MLTSPRMLRWEDVSQLHALALNSVFPKIDPVFRSHSDYCTPVPGKNFLQLDCSQTAAGWHPIAVEAVQL